MRRKDGENFRARRLSVSDIDTSECEYLIALVPVHARGLCWL